MTKEITTNKGESRTWKSTSRNGDIWTNRETSPEIRAKNDKDIMRIIWRMSANRCAANQNIEIGKDGENIMEATNPHRSDTIKKLIEWNIYSQNTCDAVRLAIYTIVKPTELIMLTIRLRFIKHHHNTEYQRKRRMRIEEITGEEAENRMAELTKEIVWFAEHGLTDPTHGIAGLNGIPRAIPGMTQDEAEHEAKHNA